MLTNRLNGTAVGTLRQLTAEVDRVFGDALDRFAEHVSRGARHTFPSVNLFEDERGFHLEAEVAGLASDDLQITMAGRTLTIRGERKAELAAEHWQRQERSFGRFERAVELPTAIDHAAITAHVAQGVLTVTLPKAAEAKLRRIPVHEGPVHEGPVHEGPVHEGPVHEGPVHEGPVQGGAVNEDTVHEDSVREDSVRKDAVQGCRDVTQCGNTIDNDGKNESNESKEVQP